MGKIVGGINDFDEVEDEEAMEEEENLKEYRAFILPRHIKGGPDIVIPEPKRAYQRKYTIPEVQRDYPGKRIIPKKAVIHRRPNK